jgi:hypothetical protein
VRRWRQREIKPSDGGQTVRIGAFEIFEPVPELHEPHALALIRPWIDVGSVGTLTLRRLEQHYGAKPLGKLARPGNFFDFTRYRPNVRFVNGDRVFTYPNSNLNYAQPEGGPDLIFLHLLEPHSMAEDYVDSLVEVFKFFKVNVYARVGAMYDSVPHTRPIVVTANTEALQPRPGARTPLIQQRQSRYEGPTTIMNLLSETATELGISSATFMAHLPHYAQLEEDFAGTARMLQVLSGFYQLPDTIAPTRRGERQYAEIDAAVQQQSDTSALVSRLEAYYDTTYQGEGAEPAEGETPPTLSPEIERFLRDLDANN